MHIKNAYIQIHGQWFYNQSSGRNKSAKPQPIKLEAGHSMEYVIHAGHSNGFNVFFCTL